MHMTALYSVLHLLVDGVCAFAMFGIFLPRGNAAADLILYNFCAFALQMPLGVALDILRSRAEDRPFPRARLHPVRAVPYFIAVAGVLCTLLGVITHPVVLGIGNALFHTGGGVATIHEDNARGWRGRGLGVFVAPGALGLYLGTLAGKSGSGSGILWVSGIFMVVLCVAILYLQNPCRLLPPDSPEKHPPARQNPIIYNIKTKDFTLAACCFLVVILRSYIGLSVAFPWKTTILGGILATLAVVLGKMAGGFLAAQYGFWRTSVISLLFAAACYAGSALLPLGIAALFLFNMTMPITLYLMICRFPKMPGFSFGLLTFGLFLGFLPEYFGLPLMAGGNITGCAGSILSLLLLTAGMLPSRKYTCQQTTDRI